MIDPAKQAKEYLENKIQNRLEYESEQQLKGAPSDLHERTMNAIIASFMHAHSFGIAPFSNFHIESKPTVCYTNIDTQRDKYYIPDCAIFDENRNKKRPKKKPELLVVIEIEKQENAENAYAKTENYLLQIGVLEYFVYLYDTPKWVRMTYDHIEGMINIDNTDHSNVIGIPLRHLLLPLKPFAKIYG